MEEMIVRGWNNIVSRFGGPMTFRVILQPTMAALLAVIAGLRDARENKPPYFWTLMTDSSQRGDLVRHGWKAIARVFVLAIVMDTIYQLVVLGWLYPLELLIVAILLAVVPYLLMRGPVNRVASWWYRRRKASVAVD